MSSAAWAASADLEEDLDAMMDDIAIDDLPDDFLDDMISGSASSSGPSNPGSPGNPGGDFSDDEDDNLSQSDEDFRPPSPAPAAAPSPAPAAAPPGAAALLSLLSSFHSSRPGSRARSPSQQAAVSALAAELRLPSSAPPADPTGLLPKLPSPAPGLAALLGCAEPGGAPPGGAPDPDRPAGSVLVLAEGLEKVGTESVVKRTNRREVVLLADALVVAKRTGRAAAEEDAKEEGASKDGEDGAPKEDTAPKEGASKEGATLELKQFEYLHDLVLVDTSRSDMVARVELPAEKASTGGLHDHDQDSDSRTSSSFSDLSQPPPAAAAPAAPGAFGFRSKLKSLIGKPAAPQTRPAAKSRASFSLKSALGMSSPPPSHAADAPPPGSAPEPLSPLGLLTAPTHPAPLPKLSPSDRSRSFALLSPTRSYVFLCPSLASHALWLSLLTAAIPLAHSRRHALLSLSPPPGWRHLAARSTPFAGALLGLPELLSPAANPSRRDAEGATCLHYAAGGGHAKVAARLLDLGADVNAMDLKGCRTPLWNAVERCDIGMSRLLIANGADLSLRDVRDATPVHAVASRGENSADAENIVRLLASSGCDVAAFDEDGDSPLHVAVKARSPRMVVALVNGGARTSVRSPLTGLTPLQAACAQPSLDPETGLFDVEVIRNLLGVGSCPNLPVRRGANVRRGTVDKAGVGAEEEERMAALHVLLCGANKEKLVVDPNKPYEDGSPRFIVDEQYCFSVFVGVMELVKSGARVEKDKMLAEVLTPTITEILGQAEAEWKKKTVDADEVGKFHHQLFNEAVGKEKWESDSASNACMLCEGTFDLLNRRHHCRMCGILVCGACTTKTMILEGGGSGRGERICDCCFNKTKSHIGELTRDAADRSRLMAKIDRQMVEEGDEEDEDDEEDRRDELFQGSRAAAPQQQSRTQGANAAMSEAMQSLGERGEKLNAINDKSAQLKDAAKDFKNMASLLKKDQQKKAGWGF
ncbi:hypothetical protein TeGR_g10078 [Tetraparma gracilis]|uniref:Uncharacterized protein n=1 Tax=Tetraparma gracilis TaxID=2962635 RepID=A0ABQ6MAZ5_9STRA|nr:hypothetical protein TeGR_g10078 [Tetraparma gracilis]